MLHSDLYAKEMYFPVYREPVYHALPTLLDIAVGQLDCAAQCALRHLLTIQREPEYSYRCDDGKMCIRVELPGVRPEHVEVSIEASKLRVTGKRFPTNEKEDVKDDREATKDSGNNEREAYVKDGVNVPEVVYVKEFFVPRTADADAARAELRNGLLEIHIPKMMNRAMRKISVNTGF